MHVHLHFSACCFIENCFYILFLTVLHNMALYITMLPGLCSFSQLSLSQGPILSYIFMYTYNYIMNTHISEFMYGISTYK